MKKKEIKAVALLDLSYRPAHEARLTYGTMKLLQELQSPACCPF